MPPPAETPVKPHSLGGASTLGPPTAAHCCPAHLQLWWQQQGNVWHGCAHGPWCVQHMRKNQYEEALFRCEDDRFELDMVIERNASAMRAMAPLVEHISSAPGPLAAAPCPSSMRQRDAPASCRARARPACLR